MNVAWKVAHGRHELTYIYTKREKRERKRQSKEEKREREIKRQRQQREQKEERKGEMFDGTTVKRV